MASTVEQAVGHDALGQDVVGQDVVACGVGSSGTTGDVRDVRDVRDVKVRSPVRLLGHTGRNQPSARARCEWDTHT